MCLLFNLKLDFHNYQQIKRLKARMLILLIVVRNQKLQLMVIIQLLQITKKGLLMVTLRILLIHVTQGSPRKQKLLLQITQESPREQ